MTHTKMKTKRAAAKRYRLTASGKVRVGHKGKRHGLSNKSRKRKRNLRGTAILAPGDARLAKSTLPYGD